MEPRLWSICLSSSDINPIISHRDFPPQSRTHFISHYGVSIFSGTILHYCSRPQLRPALGTASPWAPVHCLAHIFPACSLSPLILGQCVLLISPASRTYFGHLKSIVRLEDSYLVVSVSPESSAYGPFIPESCHIHLPPSFISLPWTRWIHYSRFTSLLSCNKHGWNSALEPFLGALIEYRTFPLLLKGRLLLGSTNFRVFVLQKLNPRDLWHSVTNCYSSRHSRPPDTALLVRSILLLSPSHSHQWHCFRSSSPDLKFN